MTGASDHPDLVIRLLLFSVTNTDVIGQTSLSQYIAKKSVHSAQVRTPEPADPSKSLNARSSLYRDAGISSMSQIVFHPYPDKPIKTCTGAQVKRRCHGVKGTAGHCWPYRMEGLRSLLSEELLELNTRRCRGPIRC